MPCGLFITHQHTNSVQTIPICCAYYYNYIHFFSLIFIISLLINLHMLLDHATHTELLVYLFAILYMHELSYNFQKQYRWIYYFIYVQTIFGLKWLEYECRIFSLSKSYSICPMLFSIVFFLFELFCSWPKI